jgi:periodic tryptophan protein 1
MPLLEPLQDEAADSEDEAEDLKVLPTDNLLVAARTQDDVSQLDIYVYDDATENLYIHHDLLLPAMPLALEWLSFTPASSSSSEKSGNFVAVATMDPEIEIWNLDMLDGLYPDAILGASKDAVSTSLETLTESIAPLTLDGKKKRKKPKKPKAEKAGPNAAYHTDSVLSLSWNRSHPSLLASSSADTTIKLWDLSSDNANVALRSYAVHDNKVSGVQWNQRAPTVLLSGAWGGALKVFDTRTAETVIAHTIKNAGDIECLCWNPHKEVEFFVGLENGQVQLFDSRAMGTKGKGRLWMLDAHQKAVSSLDYCPGFEGMLVTGGTDKIVKLWNVGTGEKATISLVASRDLGVVRRAAVWRVID